MSPMGSIRRTMVKARCGFIAVAEKRSYVSVLRGAGYYRTEYTVGTVTSVTRDGAVKRIRPESLSCDMQPRDWTDVHLVDSAWFADVAGFLAECRKRQDLSPENYNPFVSLEEIRETAKRFRGDETQCPKTKTPKAKAPKKDETQCPKTKTPKAKAPKKIAYPKERASDSDWERRAIAYAKWLAARDGIELPDTKQNPRIVSKAIWDGVYVMKGGRQVRERRIRSVGWGQTIEEWVKGHGRYGRYVKCWQREFEIVLPHWDWVQPDVIAYTEEAQSESCGTQGMLQLAA